LKYKSSSSSTKENKKVSHNLTIKFPNTDYLEGNFIYQKINKLNYEYIFPKDKFKIIIEPEVLFKVDFLLINDNPLNLEKAFNNFCQIFTMKNQISI